MGFRRSVIAGAALTVGAVMTPQVHALDLSGGSVELRDGVVYFEGRALADTPESQYLKTLLQENNIAKKNVEVRLAGGGGTAVNWGEPVINNKSEKPPTHTVTSSGPPSDNPAVPSRPNEHKWMPGQAPYLLDSYIDKDVKPDFN